MMVFYTSSAKHLACQLPFEQGKYSSKQLSDGELFIQLEENVRDKIVWVVTATKPPADHLLELFLLLNALQREHAQVNVLFAYFGYARHDRPHEGQASGAEVISTFLKTFSLKKIKIIHAHSLLLHNYLSFENYIPFDLISQKAKLYDSLAAPDQGAYELVKYISQEYDRASIFLTKIRHEQEKVKILAHDGIVNAKKILIIDDIIATGGTVIEAAQRLYSLGAQEVSVWATHGIFSGNAIGAIEKSTIKKVYVTNTLPQQHTSAKIEIISIAPLIERIMHK